MSDLNQKLERFASAILAEATAETDRTLAELAQQRDAAYASGEDKVLAEAYRYIHGEVGRIKTETGRMVSRHMMEDKRALYLRRDEIAAQVFARVRARIAAYTAQDEYPRRMRSILTDALAALPGCREARLYLRAADAALGATLTHPDVKLEVREGDFLLGGLILEAPHLGKRVDATFDSTLEDLSGRFAEVFGLTLSMEQSEVGQP